MRSYMALSGRDGAFGWSKAAGGDGYTVSFGGLKIGEVYTLPTGERITADENGRWQGRLSESPRYVAQGGQVILCDESSLTWEEAALLLRPAKKVQPVKYTEEKTEETPVDTVYRTRLNICPVDALPVIIWPKSLGKIRACFDKGQPRRVLPYPWRFVRVPGMQGEYLIGCLTENDRITKTAYAVRAKGGLLQPKGLQGYDYVRTDTGECYWMLLQDVR